MDTIVINLYGGPGAGKSTGAAYIFSMLKLRGVNCELVTEYAKDKVWENNPTALKDQYYVFGQQHYRLNCLMGKVDVVITDSPLMLSAIYAKNCPKLTEVCYEAYSKCKNIDVMVHRTKPYNAVGRINTEAQSDMIAEQIEQLCSFYGITLNHINGTKEDYDKFIEWLLTLVYPPDDTYMN